MIRLKKQQAAAKAAEAEAASQNGSTPMEESKGTEETAVAEEKGTAASGGSVKLLGIGGKSARTGASTKATKKRTPGEIRIQKGASPPFSHPHSYSTTHLCVWIGA